MKCPAWLPVLATLTLQGCSAAPPLHYYTLDTTMPVAAAPRATASPLIRVRHISLPPDMDHRGLTHRVGPTQLAVSESDLGQRLGYEHVLAPGALPAATRSDVGQATLDVDFVALSADESCGIATQVNWTLTMPGGTAQHGTVHATAPAASCPAGLPAALSAALGDITDQLAQQLPSS
jgi:uncharacterized lipoprotein YmbA